MADEPFTIRTLDRHCNNGVCHCDWRLSIQDCEESLSMWSSSSGLSLLFNRIYVKGHMLWNSSGNQHSGWLRPKPIEVRLLSSVILVADVLSTNWVARSYLYEIPWDFGLAGITIYLIGIAQTISQASRQSISGWLPPPLIVDIIGSTAVIFPFITSLAFPITAGALAESNLPLAEVFVRLTYIAWSFWTSVIGAAVFFTGTRLVRILQAYHKQSRSNRNYAAVQAGIYKIYLMIGLSSICLWGILWQYLGGITSLGLIISVFVNPTTRNKNAALKSKSSTGTNNEGTFGTGATSTVPDQHYDGGFEGSTIHAMTVTIQNDNEAILNAIERNNNKNRSSSWIILDDGKQSRKSKKFRSYFNINRIPVRRASDESSQMELTMTYNDDR
ncbi:hypothetical protein INT45_012866 [Circinella minor]|uniref:Uncharacterized protein n=1 Tax=Circinella minor TaxID=1195481 RepID=A0A8H7S951_9FUNG|nr:hypothetical protein INT45_012866 [Circinella minor]